VIAGPGTKVGAAYIDITANTDKFRRGMSDMDAQAKRATANVRNEIGKTDAKIKGVTGTLGMFSSALVALGGTAAAVQLVKIADSFTQMRNKLSLVVKEGESLAEVEEKLYQLAMKNRAALEPTVSLYARLRSARSDLSDEQALKIVDTWNKTLVISGASAAGASAATIQFSQAMAGGILRAEEFNSIVENNIRGVQLFAESLGVTMGELRALVNDGKVQFDDLVKALTADAGKVGEEFDGMAMTVGQAMTNLETATIRFVGALDEVTGGSQGLASMISMLAQAIETFTIFARGSSPAIEKMKTQTKSLLEIIADTQDEIAKGGLKDLGDDATAAISPLTEVEKKIAEINKRLEETGDKARFAAISRAEGGLILQLKEIGELEEEMRKLTTRQVGRGGDAGFTVGSRAQIKATQEALDNARRAYGDGLINLDYLKKTPGKAFIPDPPKTKEKEKVGALAGDYTALENYERSLADIREKTAKGAEGGNRAILKSMREYLEAGGNVRRVLEDVKKLSGSMLDPTTIDLINQLIAATQTAEPITVTDGLETELTDFMQSEGGGAWAGFEQRIADATKYGLLYAIETGEWGDAFGQILTDVTRDALNNALDVLWEALSQIDWGGQGQGWAGFFNMVGGSFTTKAGGGPVSAGGAYRVGELGSEWFVPKSDGFIIPNGGMGKSLGAAAQISVGGAQVIIQGDASERTAAMIAESLTAYTRALPGMIDARVTDRQKRGAY
jgi:tape measure domain-containing protein